MRVERIGDATLYLGDCRDIVPTLGKVDAVITSPPYNLSDGIWTMGHASSKWSAMSLAKGYASHADDMDPAEYAAWQEDVLVRLWKTLSETGAIFYNHKPRPRNGLIWLPTALNPGLPLRQVVIWARAGGINYSESHYMPTHEWIMIFAKPAFRLRSRGASGVGDVWYIPQAPDEDHPAPFPVALPQRIIETTGCETVLDPFMGSGTTGVGCANLGRKFVGIEIDPGYFDIACRRIEEAHRQPRLFAEPAPKIVQPSMFD